MREKLRKGATLSQESGNLRKLHSGIELDEIASKKALLFQQRMQLPVAGRGGVARCTFDRARSRVRAYVVSRGLLLQCGLRPLASLDRPVGPLGTSVGWLQESEHDETEVYGNKIAHEVPS